MRHVSFLYNLLAIGSLACLVGCDSTIPATDIEPFLSCDSPFIVKEIHKKDSTNTRSRVLPERVTINGVSFIVYLTDSVTYAYDSKGRIIRAQTTLFSGSSYAYDYVYSLGNVVMNYLIVDKPGGTPTPASSIKLLDAQGYLAEFDYNADGQRLARDVGGLKAQTWANGNLVHLLVDNDGHPINAYFLYDLSHKNIPAPYQYWGKGNRNLEISGLIYPVASADTMRTACTYQLNPQGYVKRKIDTYKLSFHNYQPYDLKMLALRLSSVADYEYACP